MPCYAKTELIISVKYRVIPADLIMLRIELTNAEIKALVVDQCAIAAQRLPGCVFAVAGFDADQGLMPVDRRFSLPGDLPVILLANAGVVIGRCAHARGA